ncbi:hypothetical protein BS78_02G342800 [Paspalum vaginatum]|nr:hypothetical protein BS78_02G342800 [Paspalum vaginatum]
MHSRGEFLESHPPSSRIVSAPVILGLVLALRARAAPYPGWRRFITERAILPLRRALLAGSCFSGAAWWSIGSEMRPNCSLVVREWFCCCGGVLGSAAGARASLSRSGIGSFGAGPELRVLDPARFRLGLRNGAAAMALSDFFWVLFRRRESTRAMGPKGAAFSVFSIYCNGLFPCSASASFSTFHYSNKVAFECFSWDCKKK